MKYNDFDWCVEHMPELYERYGNTYVVVSDKTILGVYNSFGVAVESTAGYEPGSFIVQKVGPDESAYTAYIQSYSIKR